MHYAHFSVVFNCQTAGDFELLPNITDVMECAWIIVTEDDVQSHLSKLNISKSEGPDLIHLRINYDIIHDITYSTL